MKVLRQAKLLRGYVFSNALADMFDESNYETKVSNTNAYISNVY